MYGLVGVPKETVLGEYRVALNPDVAAQLIKMGVKVQVQKDAGLASYFTDAAYQAAELKWWMMHTRMLM